MRRLTLFFCLFVATTTFAQAQSSIQADPFVIVNVPVFVLNHVRVVDGTGTIAKEDQAVVIANGKILSIAPAASLQPPAGAQVLERSGYTVIPGLVGMHNHLYYTASYSMQVGFHGEVAEPGLIIANTPYSAPRL